MTSTPDRVHIVGLGYVGLPLAVAFSKHLTVTGFDLDPTRVDELIRGHDRNGEVQLDSVGGDSLEYVTDPECLSDASFIIVAVPTPVDENNEPVLDHLESASRMVGHAFKSRSEGLQPPVVVYESTTFPGCTEEICGPAIGESSGLEPGVDFKLGYSPERTNFGDAEHTLQTVIKVVSGQDEETTSLIETVYGQIAISGTHRAPDIRTAEAAKVIENVQRDLNIALVNELAILFDRLGLSTSDVLDAASTKWNFSRYSPGLVGGHCIPVDPYYLTYKAEEAGFHPSLILAGRNTNEQIPGFIEEKLRSLLGGKGKHLTDCRVLIMGVAFKPNVSDIRNSKAITLAKLLAESGARIEVYDPLVDVNIMERMDLVPGGDPSEMNGRYDAIIVATGHDVFLDGSVDNYCEWFADSGVMIDIPGDFSPSLQDLMESRGDLYWRP
ncbi:MAG: nucleotide sugar dehydrogenase [Chloroflexi bacterium]|jgi:UDP-N-acetyl-D-glucosamine/UDP-N-acetyl-D-galactosamine dehydrogenase|nr:nucleotide sugar dehydrogenase [Chloroflexota bacterium]